MRNDKENLIVNKTFQFSLQIITFCDILEENKKYTVARQVLKSGTSIGANVREAQNAESKADFIHKMKIAAKECEETDYWLSLSQLSPTYPNCEKLIEELSQIMRILSKIISSSKIDH
jgi:four helix bundle protein